MIAASGKICPPRKRSKPDRFVAPCLLTLLAGVVALPLRADDRWPQFRGPLASGVAESSALPTNWSAEQNVVWKKPIPGVGWSQPIVWGDRIFLTTAISDEQAKPSPDNGGPGFGGLSDFNLSAAGGAAELPPPEATYHWDVICLDATSGEARWQRTLREGRPPNHIHPNNTYASETPATDGERVIAYFGMAGLYCFDMDGQPLWNKELGVFPTQFGWGTASSPVLWEDRVFVQCDNDQESFLIALDKRTGDELWRIPREEEKSNWATPYLWKNKLRTELVTAGGGKMRSYDPTSGKLLWEMKGQGRAAVTPVGDDELLYVDSADRLMGIRGRIHAIRAGAAGDVSLSRKENTGEFVAWSANLSASRLASPLLWQGRLYVFEQSAIVHCYDAKTGEEFERQRLPGVKGFVASPLAAGGKIYCLDQTGATLVLEPAAKLNVLSTNPLHEMCWSSPAIAGNRLLLRGTDHLFCIGAP